MGREFACFGKVFRACRQWEMFDPFGPCFRQRPDERVVRDEQFRVFPENGFYAGKYVERVVHDPYGHVDACFAQDVEAEAEVIESFEVYAEEKIGNAFSQKFRQCCARMFSQGFMVDKVDGEAFFSECESEFFAEQVVFRVWQPDSFAFTGWQVGGQDETCSQRGKK